MIGRRQARQVRCFLCEKYDLQCNSATHTNALTQYLPLVQSTEWRADQARKVPVVIGEETQVMRRPDYVPPTYSYTRTYGRRPLRPWILPVLVALALVVLAAGFATTVLFGPVPQPTSTFILPTAERSTR